MSKQYGLIKPKEQKKLAGSNFFQKKNIFDDDSDEDGQSPGPPGTFLLTPDDFRFNSCHFVSK